MSTDFDVGDQVSFYGGKGCVIDVSKETLQVLTTDGKTRKVSPTQPLLKKVDDATEGDLLNFLGGRARVVSVQERNGRPDLLYLRTQEGDLKKIPTDAKGLEPGLSIENRLTTGDFGDPIRFGLRERAARLNLAYRSDRFLSLSGNRIRIEPYQVDAAHRVLNAYEPRFLIADEVGLGKTIEAGIILEELIARGRAERVLILTPASLRDQWQAEMKDKFGREYIVYDRGYIKACQKPLRSKNPWTFDDKIVTSIDFAKQDDMLETLKDSSLSWDVVVIDEAHHLTARNGTDGVERVDRYRVGEALADRTDALLFLTGTPHKGKPDQFYHLLRLLDPYRFRGPEDINPEQLEDLMIRRVKSDDSLIDTDGTPMFPEREIMTLPVELTEDERELYDDLTEYISAIYTVSAKSDKNVAGFTQVIYQKRLVSSIRAIAKSLQNRREDLEEKVKVPKSIADQLNTVDNTANTEDAVVKQLIEATKAIDVDSKGNRLREFLESKGVFEEDPEKVLLFTEYTDTLEYLRDEVLADSQTVEIHGGMNQEQRREAINQFRNEASVLLATDAAREGLNLQFSHIMVNYDLPWNPIRIDQRMGRLHRYGQEEKVEIYNLFAEDTRESDILQLLMEKMDQIESDLGMRSDVLGTVLDDYDVKGAIMDAVTGKRDSREIQRDLKKTIEERKDAVERIEKEFLIRDKFDGSDHDAIENLIDLSKENPISEDDIEQLVRQFCYIFGGNVVPEKMAGDSKNTLYQIDVPDIITMNTDISEIYQKVTFSRTVALDELDAELVSLNHPLVQAIVEYCLDGNWIDGQAAGLVAVDSATTPGLLLTYRLGYVSGDGEIPTEDYTRVFIDTNGTVREKVPDIVGALPQEIATAHPDSREAAESVSLAIEEGKTQAEEVVEDLLVNVRESRQQDVEIKEKHAERYFQEKIRDLESQLSKYEIEEKDTEKDMRVVIRSTQKKLEDIEHEWEQEQGRLERERLVVSDEPKLINAAVVTAKIPAVDADEGVTANDQLRAIKTADEDMISFIANGEFESVSSLAKCPVRLLRSAKLVERVSDLTRQEIDGIVVYSNSEDSGAFTADEIRSFYDDMVSLLENIGSECKAAVCLTKEPVEAVHRNGEILFNLTLDSSVSESYWRVVAARETAFADTQLPAERRIQRIQKLLR